LIRTILFLFREFRNWQDDYVSRELSVSIQEYKRLESGLDKVDLATALKLSELYSAPPLFFLSKNYSNDFSIIYSHCHFENSNGYVNHLYHDNEDLVKAKDQTIQLLKEAVVQLQKENEKLLERLLTKQEDQL
jgi:transcriptional regulator with XRE-family HTH domain